MSDSTITPDLLLNAYASGLFPMADSRSDDDIFWVDPVERGILPLNGFHVPRSLSKTIRKAPFTVTVNRAFRAVMQGCAAPTDHTARKTTWISDRIETLYCDLHERGFAHSVECWHEGQLVGGLYGVCLNGAFFGESMFHTMTDASKVALVHLVARLNAGGFRLLDTQFGTDHLARFGVVEIPRAEYLRRLDDAIEMQEADFYRLSPDASPDVVLQFSTQTS